LSLQPVLFGLLVPSLQTGAPVLQAIVPFLQKVGLVVQETPAAQGIQVPALLQTMSVPQDEPAAFRVLLLHTIAPVVQSMMPV